MGRIKSKRLLRRAIVHNRPRRAPDRTDNLERIKTITQTARGIWFGYLGALAFTGVTLLGVKDVDFFSLESSTQLPLINVSVPVQSFFWAGAVLIAMVFGYLHVFLEKLWRELGRANARHGNEPLAASRFGLKPDFCCASIKRPLCGQSCRSASKIEMLLPALSGH